MTSLAISVDLLAGLQLLQFGLSAVRSKIGSCCRTRAAQEQKAQEASASRANVLTRLTDRDGDSRVLAQIVSALPRRIYFQVMCVCLLHGLAPWPFHFLRGLLSKRQRQRRREQTCRQKVWDHAKSFTSGIRYRKAAYNAYFSAAVAEFQISGSETTWPEATPQQKENCKRQGVENNTDCKSV